MEYEGQICRSPMERSSFMLPVMVGCSYNRCKFCMLFKHLTYRRLPMEQIFADIRRVADLGGDPKWVFLGDGNAFSLPAEDLLTILQEIRWAFPSCQGVNMDATVTSIAQKTDEQLRLLAQAGVSHLYLGIESGLDDVLRLMDKDHTKAQAMEQIRRIQQAGMVFDAHIMTGVAGKGRGRENALALGEIHHPSQPGGEFLHVHPPESPSVPTDSAREVCSGGRRGNPGRGAGAASPAVEYESGVRWLP